MRAHDLGEFFTQARVATTSASQSSHHQSHTVILRPGTSTIALVLHDVSTVAPPKPELALGTLL